MANIKAKTKQDALSKLHEALASHLMAKLESGEVTASDLNVVRQFLKDNGVNCDPEVLQPMGDALADLPTFDPADAPSLYVEQDDNSDSMN